MLSSALRPTVVDQSWFVWGLALVIGFPLLVIVLGEVQQQLARRNSAVAGPLRLVRNILLPGVVVLLFIRLVLERGGAEIDVQVWTTVVWMLGLGIVLSLVTSIVFDTSDADTWRGRAPRLFVDMIRLALVAVGAAIVIGSVWGVNLGALFAALGVGGIVIGLALQDTLASLLAGIALLQEKPFTVGDWVVIGDVEGKIIDINWRTVRLQNREEDLIVIPNKVFGDQITLNNSRPDIIHIEVVPLGFSYNDPPSKVQQVLFDVATSTPGVLHDPAPVVRTVAYNDFSVDYQVWMHVESYDKMPDIRSEFMSRVWYAAKRHELNIPFPIRTVQRFDADRAAEVAIESDFERRRTMLSSLTLGEGDLSGLADQSEILRFAPGETLLREGSRSDGLGLVMSGRAVASVRDANGAAVDALSVGRGEFYGELAAFASETNRLTVRAETDTEVIVVARSAVQQLAQRSGRFASEIEQVVEARRAVIDRVLNAHRSSDNVGS